MFRMIPLLFAALLLAAPLSGPAYAARDDVFKDTELGLKLKKPGDWVFLSADEMVAASGGDAESVEGLVVTAARYPEPTPKLNPTAQVYHVQMPTTGVVPESVLDAMMRQIGMGSQLFDILEPLREIRVSGHPGAAVSVRHHAESVANEGEVHTVISRMWAVVRGQDLFLLVFSGPAEGPDVSEREFEKIFKSLRIKG